MSTPLTFCTFAHLVVIPSCLIGGTVITLPIHCRTVTSKGRHLTCRLRRTCQRTKTVTGRRCILSLPSNRRDKYYCLNLQLMYAVLRYRKQAGRKLPAVKSSLAKHGISCFHHMFSRHEKEEGGDKKLGKRQG